MPTQNFSTSELLVTICIPIIDNVLVRILLKFFICARMELKLAKLIQMAIWPNYKKFLTFNFS